MKHLLAVLLWAAALASCSVHVEAGAHGSPSVRHHRAAGALGPYSAVVEAGPFLFLSGRIGERGGSYAREAETAIDGVEEELERHGASLADVVSVTLFLTDMECYGETNAIYAARFPAPYPTRTCVEVARLPGDARIEITAIARR
ncbi:MAG: reactive intermediate/imine deaminase [Planctomycetes bacterium]|jgi:2-iminobutanoate/2-iminopropanoate deaminase|nr:reactive intermediate/imine deaminase [Planctomycetota bacterium]MDP6408168.1 Rid family hydrolase [Planctomycetota bacterium]